MLDTAQARSRPPQRQSSVGRGLGIGLTFEMSSAVSELPALVTLGLYIASSLLMQHAVGSQWGGISLLALAGYALAIRFTFSIARGRAPR